MPVWGWVLLIACLCALLVAAVLVIVRSTHRMRSREPLHGDPTNIAATVPVHVSEAESMTPRELEDERGRAGEAEQLGGTPTPSRRSP
jgi:hypothetical protein